MEPRNYMQIDSPLAQMGFCFAVFQYFFWGEAGEGEAQQNNPKRKLYVKASLLQSGSDQFKDAKFSRFGIQDFHSHIELVFMVHK